MAVPPVRLDVFQNIVNVGWGSALAVVIELNTDLAVSGYLILQGPENSPKIGRHDQVSFPDELPSAPIEFLPTDAMRGAYKLWSHTDIEFPDFPSARVSQWIVNAGSVAPIFTLQMAFNATSAQLDDGVRVDVSIFEHFDLQRQTVDQGSIAITNQPGKPARVFGARVIRGLGPEHFNSLLITVSRASKIANIVLVP